jgi:hypothetical protein
MAKKSGLTMSKASVIILVWNGREYLEACLGAVLAQDYRDLPATTLGCGQQTPNHLKRPAT